MEQCSALCLRRRANNMFECPALNKDGGVVQCFVVVEGVWIGCTVEIAIEVALCAIDNKIGGIRVNAQLHVSSKKAEYCIWI
eukprot:7695138-Ditylum_brightwellii.AAC.1